MQFKLVAATVASLALSGVLAAPPTNIVSREQNAQQAQMSQLNTLNKQAADADQAISAQMGDAFKQAWESNYDVNHLEGAKIPCKDDFQKLKNAMQSKNQSGSQKRDAAAWVYPFGSQAFVPYWGNVDFWGNPWNYMTAFGYYGPSYFGYKFADDSWDDDAWW
ncbi:hypothetical protein CERZMDRAFT_83088 [Cercospora zeae-maydis SCOH1-5]|uniref:Uncharacterized protein n=1 Tax=Cercospora zeae-maydis SCOH1-5 TaxID=717836 RepID=A0A6A6FM57_9PEZI|nr:hypothetical protein CERZMDRAFT_83088 [Cercospora zeae-maydis SCOH1-5]